MRADPETDAETDPDQALEGSVFAGDFFDGKVGEKQRAQVVIGAAGLNITTVRATAHWPYADLAIDRAQAETIRIGNRRHEGAVLILPRAAAPALEAAAPETYTGVQARRRTAALIASLVGGASVVAAGLFIGVPAAAGPLARATPAQFEQRIGHNLAAQITTFMKPCGDDAATARIAQTINDMAEAGDAGFPITFRFVDSRAPNAFALPGGQVMATSGLLAAIGDDQEAFFAVMAHEIGHVRARDGMQAVYRNAGLGMALEFITGGSGVAQQLVLVGGQLNQLRHTRRQEAAADAAAAEIMIAADMDPAALARAFDAITRHASKIEDSKSKKKEPAKSSKALPSWLRSHPQTEGRKEFALSQAKAGGPPPLPAAEWRQASSACNEAATQNSAPDATAEK